MQIFVRGNGKTHALSVEEADTIGSLKTLLVLHEGIDAADQVLSLNGAPLSDDSQSLAGVLEHSTFDLTSRLLGGKVHGSLARAGKVKGQTPKVEAQEKKKKKTGRAKRRIQYNRRFVNVVTQPGGRKRGPNANPAT